ncbi:hypothetical protein M5K25_007500 [Dendrobium thyrsiflorum]|uniref:Reverse transcriptase zinc-binding domain-containing protein n=1 Tax=Dendrobium thyrsiflorum TaxID=117978 RepID=A0ABD0VLQ3_DENTH
MAGLSSSNPWFAKDSKSRSFKEVVEGASGVKIDFVHSTVKGLPALLFEDSVVSKLAAPFSFTLVGKFMLKRPNIDTIRKFFVNLKLSGTFSVGLMDQRHIAIQLSNDLDYSRIFARRVYYILGCQMRLLKWSPDFDVREEPPIVPVWISFPNLRLHFFNHQVLFALASIFGRPLQTDQATLAISRPSVARVLVELDVTKKHPREVWLGSEFNGYFQRVEFENLPIFCVHCKMHGHSMVECFILHPSLRKHKENVQSSEGINVVANKISEEAKDAGENQNAHHVAEDTSRPVGNGDEFSGSHGESVEGLQGNKEIVDEQMLAELKPVDASLKANCSENNFDRICCSENAIDNVDLQDTTVIRDLEEGELVGSPNLLDNPKAAPPEQTQNEHDSSGMINSICRQNIVELTNCDEALQNNKGIGCPSTRIRLKNLCRIHNITLLVIIEPFIDASKMDSTSSFLGFKHRYANISNKIWVLWKELISIDILGDFNQVLHCQIKILNISLYASFIYASSFYLVRKQLWKLLTDFCDVCDGPWFVGGDFNSICNTGERIGGCTPKTQAMEDFNNMIMDCNLVDVGFSGNAFTWNRGCMWQRLDRILFNSTWVNTLFNTSVEHLSKTYSDHAPLLITFQDSRTYAGSSFRFQNMWFSHEEFLFMVKENWEAPLFPNNDIYGMERLWHKLKRLKYKLVWWNRTVFKNIFANILEAEDKVNTLENICQSDPSAKNMLDVQEAKKSVFLLQDQEEVFWKQKAASKHLLEGDRNTKYYHSLFKNNRAKSNINKIVDSDGNHIEGNENISNSAVTYFHKAFNTEFQPSCLDLPNLIPDCITEHDNNICFVTSPKMAANRVTAIKRISGFQQATLPIKYLGIPLFKGRKKSFLFDDLIGAVRNKLNSWDYHFLSFGGRLTLIKSVLCSLPIYTFQTLLPTNEVFNRMDILINKFFWRGKSNSSKFIWASWIKCCGAIEEGALGCKSLRDSAHVFSCKLWFKFRAQKCVWSQFMWVKYCNGCHPSLGNVKMGDSRIWSRMCSVKWQMEPLINWNIGNANVFFWQDNWVDNLSIDRLLNTMSKDTCKLSGLIPELIIQKIINTPFNLGNEDKLNFTLTNNNCFNAKKVWNYFRTKFPTNKVFSMVWHRNIPATVSVFVWRLLHKFVPADDMLIDKGISVVSKCQCCFHVENINHIFVSGPVAFFNPLLSIKDLIYKWFSKDKGHITHLVCALIVWNLWVARNIARFNGKPMEIFCGVCGVGEALWYRFWVLKGISFSAFLFAHLCVRGDVGFQCLSGGCCFRVCWCWFFVEGLGVSPSRFLLVGVAEFWGIVVVVLQLLVWVLVTPGGGFRIVGTIWQLLAVLENNYLNYVCWMRLQQGGEALTKKSSFFLFHPYTVIAENPSFYLRQRTATLPFSPLLGDGREPSSFLRQRTATLPFSPLLGDGREPSSFLGREPQHFLFHHSLVMAENPLPSSGREPQLPFSPHPGEGREPRQALTGRLQQGGEALTKKSSFFLFHPYTVMAENPSSYLRQRTATLPFSPLLGDGREPSSFLRQRTATLPFSPLLGDGREPSSFLRQRTATLPFSPLLGDGREPSSFLRQRTATSFFTTPRSFEH